jgi:protein TonB
MQREKKDKHFIKKPVYPGGPQALRQFIAKNLQYPKTALKEKLEGTVVLKYTIDHEGRVTEANVVSGIGKGCDEEAIRVTKLLKFQVPKLPGKKTKVVFHNKLKVHFRLPKAKEQLSGVQYQYTTPTKTSPEEQEAAPSKIKSYTYTIEF